MNRDNASLLDIFNAAQRILKFTEGLNRDNLATNEEKQFAILYQIIIISEAVKRLSPAFRQQYSDIPWKEIAGMRDILAHQYDRINLNVLWDVVQRDIPELISFIDPLLPKIDSKD
ncbi:MAG: DUF86 domain-containing protein [Snowella sp.]|nr:DUF86 domain-containing protein [Snowella sp.]